MEGRAAAGDSGSASASARFWLRLADGGGGAGALIAAYYPEARVHQWLIRGNPRAIRGNQRG